jgi:4-amino-4-deoxy-L-arabinose transferase-like glycosyltransferase
MLRALLGPIPLAIAAAILVVLWVFGRRRWPRAPLVVIAILAAGVLCLLALGLVADRHQGAYQPAHMENGRLIPGRME